MADYKDFITGTLNTIFTKAKDVAGSVAETVSESGGVKDLCEQGANKAKAYGRIAKLTIEVGAKNEDLKKVYAEIGRLCYEQFKADPSDTFAALFTQVEAITSEVEAKQAEIQSLKTSEAADADIDVEIEQFDDVVSATECDGAAEVIEKAADTVEDAVEAAAEKAEDIVEDIKD